MPGLGQHVQATEQPQRGVVHDVAHVAAAAAAGELERHQREHRAQRGQLPGRRPAGRVDQPGEIERDQLADEQEQPGVLRLHGA